MNEKNIDIVCLGRVIRNLRKEHGLTIDSLSKHTNVATSVISRTERGESEVGWISYIVLEEYFKVSFTNLINIEKEKLSNMSALQLLIDKRS